MNRERYAFIIELPADSNYVDLRENHFRRIHNTKKNEQFATERKKVRERKRGRIDRKGEGENRIHDEKAVREREKNRESRKVDGYKIEE